MANTFELELDAVIEELEIEDEPKEKVNPDAGLLADKNVDPKSRNYKRKGKSHYQRDSPVDPEQWFIRYDGDEDDTRVKWWQLDSNVAEGDYGRAIYKGINPTFRGKEGDLKYTSKKWYFHFGEDKIKLNNPDSVTIIGG